MIRILKISLVVLSILLTETSCYYDKFEELHPVINSGCDSASATYSNHIAKIVNTYCVGCHNNTVASGGVLLDNYNNVKAEASSGRLMNALKGNGLPTMPPNTPLDECKVGSIYHWINSGMPNN
jgi:mono/diheme cytochrome c family protein